jgi:hypothetical protein
VSFLDSATEQGRLDVTHLGMWLNIDDARRAGDDRFAPLMARALAHDIGDEHHEYVAGLATDEQRVAALGGFTVVAHESRHFHDLLLTPYGAAVMSQHFRQAFTMLSSMGSLLASDAVIVPITEWAGLLPVLQRLDPGLGPPPPKIGNLSAVLGETDEELRALDQGTRYPGAPVTATQILEASALLVQIALAGRAFGGADLLFRAVADGPARERYLGAPEYIQQRLGPLPIAALQLILLASLCGDTFNPAADALRSPADVLYVLVESMATHPAFPRPEPAAATTFSDEVNLVFGLVQEIFGRLWNCELEDMMDRALDQTSANAAEWSRRIEGKDDGGLTYRWIANAAAVYRQFAEVSGRLIANFSMNPVWYLADQYLDALPFLPRPLMFLWSEAGIASTPEIQEAFTIHQQIEVPHQEGVATDPATAAMHAAFAANAYDDGTSLRSALVISLRDNRRATEGAPPFAFLFEDIELPAWREYFDTVVPTFRLLAYGPDDGLPAGLGAVPLQILGLRGTRVYAPSGLLPEPPPFLRRSPEGR